MLKKPKILQVQEKKELMLKNINKLLKIWYSIVEIGELAKEQPSSISAFINNPKYPMGLKRLNRFNENITVLFDKIG